jgi:hypothetical protein
VKQYTTQQSWLYLNNHAFFQREKNSDTILRPSKSLKGVFSVFQGSFLWGESGSGFLLLSRVRKARQGAKSHVNFVKQQTSQQHHHDTP